MFIQFIFLIIYGALEQPTAARFSRFKLSDVWRRLPELSGKRQSGVCPMGIELEGEGRGYEEALSGYQEGTDRHTAQSAPAVRRRSERHRPAGLEEELQDTLGRQEGRSRKLPYILKRRADRPATHRRPYILRRFINVQIE